MTMDKEVWPDDGGNALTFVDVDGNTWTVEYDAAQGWWLTFESDETGHLYFWDADGNGIEFPYHVDQTPLLDIHGDQADLVFKDNAVSSDDKGLHVPINESMAEKYWWSLHGRESPTALPDSSSSSASSAGFDIMQAAEEYFDYYLTSPVAPEGLEDSGPNLEPPNAGW